MPIVSQGDRAQDPDRFALNITGDVDGDKYSLVLWPIPFRSAVDAIVVTYEVDYTFNSAVTSTPIPYPRQFYESIIFYSCYYILAFKDNATDREQAMTFKNIADQEIRENRPVDALTKTVTRREFP